MARSQPFVAQEKGLSQLERFYRDARLGQATVCFVSGEPGAGKTALIEHFAGRLQQRDPDVVVAHGSCNAQTGVGDPYLPFREALTQLTGDVEEEVEQGRMSEENASRLRKLAEISRDVFVESGPDLVGLLVPGGSLLARFGARVMPDLSWSKKARAAAGEGGRDQAPPGTLDQERIFEQVTEVLGNLAREQPLVLLLDDLHWADEASIALLFHLSRRLGEAPVLLIGAYRPGDLAMGRAGQRHPLEAVLNEIKRYEGDVRVDLDGNAEESRRGLFEALVDLEPNVLDREFREALYRRTEGHPLFTLELLRHMREEGHLRRDDEGRWAAETMPDWTGMPARVEGVIGERLARVDDDLRDAIQVGCVEGERFRVQIVARVLDREERSLIRRLSGELDKKHQIVRSEGVGRVAGHRVATYRFRHHLFQEYLYESLDEVERAYLHEAVGEALEELFGANRDEIAPELAYHFEAAGVPEKAVEYYEAAGHKARELFATSEAIRHFRKALDQAGSLPEGEARDSKELGLQLRLGPCLVASRGYGAPETRATYERARELCERLGRQLDAPILRALAIAGLAAADHADALSFSERLMRLARREGDDVLVVEGHYALGVTCFWMGRFGASREHLEQALEQYRPEHQGVHMALYAQDPKVVCLCRLGLTLWYAGHPDSARRLMDESLALARQLEHPHSLGYVLYFAAQLHVAVGDLRRADTAVDELIAVTDQGALPFWMQRLLITQAFVRAARGAVEDGIARMERSLAEYSERGNTLGVPEELGRLAQLHLERGAIVEGLDVVSRALDLVERTDERYPEAELHRLKGELSLAAEADRADAERCLQRALEVARRQEARSLELRAAMALGRVWHENGRTAEARDLLHEAFDSFSGGFDTRDLQDASGLLREWA